MAQTENKSDIPAVKGTKAQKLMGEFTPQLLETVLAESAPRPLMPEHKVCEHKVAGVRKLESVFFFLLNFTSLKSYI